jgi:CRP-like cAMP-binding protein
LDRLELLQQMPIFGALSTESMDLLLNFANVRVFQPGAYLFKENDKPDGLYVLEEGRVKVVRDYKGKAYRLGDLGPGDCVGEMALIDMDRRSASVIATQPCQTIHISGMTLYQLRKQDLEQFVTIQLNLSREISRRLRDADQKLFELKIAQDIPGHAPI